MDNPIDVVHSYRMYVEGIYACLAAQDSKDLTGEIARLIDAALLDLYLEGFNAGWAAATRALQPTPRKELTKDLEEMLCEAKGDRDWDIVITGLKSALALVRKLRL